MTPIRIRDIAELFGAEVVGLGGDELVSGFTLDSREVSPGDLYIAVKGARVDGNAYSSDAIHAGAIAVLSDKRHDVPTLLVTNVVHAIAEFGSSLRSKFVGPVIGITGSNGKTATKEFTAAAVSPLGEIVKSPGNRNTELTSPLIWSEVDENTRAVVVELAMRGAGQIKHLAEVHRPTLGIVTMIGTAHAEMVGSREGIAEAKSELLECLPQSGHAILWAEDVYLGFLRSKCICNVHTFGFSPDADCRILGYRAIDIERSHILGAIGEETFDVELPTIGRHQALNAAAAILAANLLGIDARAATERIRHATVPPMRMQVIRRRGATILLDTYNASPDSSIAAITTLAELPCKGRRIAIIGEMRELGAFEETGHRLVGRAIAESPVDRVVFVGSATRFAQDEALRAGMPGSRFVTPEPVSISDLSEVVDFIETTGNDDLILIKASRALGLETILTMQPVKT